MLTHADVCSTAGEEVEFVSHDSRFPCFRVRASECPAGTQFTSFTSTKVQIVTESVVQSSLPTPAARRCSCRRSSRYAVYLLYSCFTGIKVQILTRKQQESWGEESDAPLARLMDVLGVAGSVRPQTLAA